MSALDDVIHYHADNCQSGSECDLSALSRAELAQLHADLQAAQERITEQARQLTEAREFAEYVCDNEMSMESIHSRAKNWLDANPAPQEQQP